MNQPRNLLTFACTVTVSTLIALALDKVHRSESAEIKNHCDSETLRTNEAITTLSTGWNSDRRHYDEALELLRSNLTAVESEKNKLEETLAQLKSGVASFDLVSVQDKFDNPDLRAKIQCKDGEIQINLTRGAESRLLTLSAGGIELRTNQRVLDISENGIAIYSTEGTHSEKNALWHTPPLR